MRREKSENGTKGGGGGGGERRVGTRSNYRDYPGGARIVSRDEEGSTDGKGKIRGRIGVRSGTVELRRNEKEKLSPYT